VSVRSGKHRTLAVDLGKMTMGRESSKSSAQPPTQQGGIKRLVRPLFATVAAAFLLLAGWDLHKKWDGAAVDVHLGLFFVAAVFAAAAMILQWGAWRILIESWTQHRMPPALSGKLYMDSQMARYTPGKIGLPAVRIAGAKQVGVSVQAMASALFAEVVSWCGTGTVVGCVAMLVSGQQVRFPDWISGSLVLGGVGALAGLLLTSFVNRSVYPERLSRLLGLSGEGPLVPWRVPLLHIVHFSLWTGCGALLALAVGAPWGLSLLVGGLLCLAIVLGFLALLAPAGVGVREAVMTAGAAPLVGASAALSVGILARVASLLTDVLLWLLFRVWAQAKRS